MSIVRPVNDPRACAAIRDEMEAAFAADPSIRVGGQVTRFQRMLTDVIRVEGETSVSHGDSDAVLGIFSAILVKRDGKWEIASLEESALPQPESPAQALSELEWLIGTWSDEGEAEQVESTFRWSPRKTFLIRSITRMGDDDEPEQGTQIIGWDPRARQIRSWTFNSDGSFGADTWSRSGSDWLIRSTQTLGDGRAASGTFVLTRVDDDTLSLQLIGHEVEGEPLPASNPVTAVRVVPSESAANSPADPAPGQP